MTRNNDDLKIGTHETISRPLSCPSSIHEFEKLAHPVWLELTPFSPQSFASEANKSNLCTVLQVHDPISTLNDAPFIHGRDVRGR